VFSWLALRGRCRGCKAPISIQYPLVELLTALLFVACVWRFGFGWQGFGAMLLTCFLIALSGIDLRTRLLPDQLTLPLLWLGLMASLDNLFIGPRPPARRDGRLRVSLWSVYWLFKQLTGKEGMGHGDFKLLAALGAWCGAGGGCCRRSCCPRWSAPVSVRSGWPQRAATGHADPVRPVPRHRRLDQLHVGQGSGRDVYAFRRPGLNLPTLHRQTAPHE
jgi:hypothetical protein